MSKAWPLVKLGEVIEKSQNWIDLNAQKEYKEVTVRLWGKGVTLRGIVTGSQIAGSRRLQVHSNQFILSRIDARNGAFGLIPDELDNAVVSNDFPVFDIHQNRLLPKYLHWLSKTKNFVESCKNVSEGTTNRVRLKEDKFIKIEIPLPPLADQQRIVAKIERLAGKIEEGKELRSISIVETETIFQSASYTAWSNQERWHKAKIGDIVKIVSGQVDPKIEPYASLPHINGESMQAKTGRLLNNYRIAKEDGVTSGKFHFKPRSILYSKIRPYLRKAVIVPFEGICSADVYAIEEIDKRINPSFMKYTLISPQFTAYAIQKSGRTRMPKLNQKQLFDYIMAFPSIEEQTKIANYLDNLQTMTDRIKAIQSQTAAELDAMLPSILDKAFKGQL